MMNFSWFALRATVHSQYKREFPSLTLSLHSFVSNQQSWEALTNRDNAYIPGPPNSRPSLVYFPHPWPTFEDRQNWDGVFIPESLAWTHPVYTVPRRRGVFSLRHSQHQDASPETGKKLFQADGSINPITSDSFHSFRSMEKHLCNMIRVPMANKSLAILCVLSTKHKKINA